MFERVYNKTHFRKVLNQALEEERLGFNGGGKVTNQFGTFDTDKKIGRPSSTVKNLSQVKKSITNREKTTGVSVGLEGGKDRPDGKRQQRIRVRPKKGLGASEYFDATPEGYKLAEARAKEISANVSSKVKTRSQIAQIGNKSRIGYNNLKKEFTQEAINWLDENASKKKYKVKGGVELLQKDLVKAFNKPKYTKIPKEFANKLNTPFVKGGKINWPTNYDVLPGINTGSNTKFLSQSLSSIKLLEKNDNFKNLSLNLNEFYTGKKSKENFAKPILDEMRFFSGRYVNQPGSVLGKYLTQKGFDFKNKIYNQLAIETLDSKIQKELNDPNVSESRKKFLTKQLSQVRRNRDTVLKNLKNKYPSMFQKNSFILEHRAAQAIGVKSGTPFSKNFFLRAQYAPSAFNAFKNIYLDRGLTSLAADYNLETDKTKKLKLKKEIQNKFNTFNNATKVQGKGYLDDVKLSFGNKLIVSDKTPYVGSLNPQDVEKQIIKNAAHSNAFFKSLGNKNIVLQNKVYKPKNFFIDIPKVAKQTAVTLSANPFFNNPITRKIAAGATGVGLPLYMTYDIASRLEQGKGPIQALEEGIIGTEIAKSINEYRALSPEGKAARSIIKQTQATEDPLYGSFFTGASQQELEKAQEIYNMEQAKAQQQIKQEQQQRAQRIKEQGLGAFEGNYGP